jgi:hypothetical protein
MEYAVKHYKEHPEEIDGYLRVNFTEYYKDKNMAALVIALNTIAKALDLPVEVVSTWDSINNAVIAMGYRMYPIKAA